MRRSYRGVLQNVTTRPAINTTATNTTSPTTTNTQHIPKQIGRADEVANSGEDQANTKLYWNVTHERCDYERIRCMRAYATGAVCARTLYYQYYSFPNYCALEFHNCVGRYDGIWSVAYMGICTEIDIQKEIYVDLAYTQMSNNSFLTDMYIADSGDLTNVG
ncbi:uncharacterized protein LOC125238405 isoform X2 [Leguminivora glycinivorella]|nr:uncharacterized protein LOC125238405 isoform X2 [Leguminivora glycinivorella]